MRIMRTMLLTGVVVLAIAGCGNASTGKASGDKSPNGTTGTNACTTQGVSDDEIVIGQSVPQSGPLAVTSTIAEGRQAFFNKVNDDGGVNGRKITLRTYDDQGEPDKTIANVKRLIDQDKVFAVTGTVGTVQGQGAMKITQSAGVPMLFPVSGSGIWSDPLKPLVFGFQPTYPNEASLFAHHIAEEFDGKKVGILAQSDDAGDEWIGPFKDALAGTEAELVATERFDLAAQDVSANLSNLQSADTEVVALFGRVDILAKALTESDARGYHPTFVVSNIGLSDQLFDLVSDPSIAEGTLIAGYFDDDSGSSARAEHAAAMGKTPVDDFTLLGWSGAQVMVEAIDKAGDDLDCETFLGALESMKDFDNHLAPPISFSDTDHQAIDSEYFVEVKDGKFVKVTPLLDPSGQPIS